MKIEIRLKEALEQIKQGWDGTIQSLAKEAQVDRHTIKRLCSNDMTNPPLEAIGRLCGWLIDHGYPADRLPQALFAAAPDKLWDLIFQLKQLTFILGEYNRVEERYPAKYWISTRDAWVAGQVIEHVSMLDSRPSGQKPRLRTQYVPFHFGSPDAHVAEEQFKADKANAKEIFKTMRSSPPKHGAMMIGSQKVNYITEYFIADLFNVQPFTTPVGKCKVPFFLIYRSFDREMASCCAGMKLPGSKKENKPGIYYRDPKGEWVGCPWVEDAHDAGITIVTYDSGTGNIELATLGLSGLGTATLGAKLIQDGQLFWSMSDTTPKTHDRSVAVFISRMSVKRQGSGTNNDSLQPRTIDPPVQIDSKTLTECLA
jgi:hypothetical protein